MAKRSVPNGGRLVAVPTIGAAPVGWRDDLDPRALPPTEHLTLGQRRVLEACLVLFAEEGFAASSIRDIASAAGMQSASLYNHFPSKDAMLSALVMLGLETHVDRMIGAIVNTSTEPREQLRSAIYAHIKVHCEYPNLGLVGNHEQRHLVDEMKPQVESIRRRSAVLVTEVIDRGVEQGVFSIGNPRMTILALASMGVDAARWYPYQTEISDQQLSDEYAELALRMVGA